MKVLLLLTLCVLCVSAKFDPEQELDIRSTVNVDADKLDLTEEEKTALIKDAEEQEASATEPEQPETMEELKAANEEDKAGSEEDNIPGTKSISYKQPKLTEEEQRSHYFPVNMKCDACQIVVHSIGTAFQAKENRIPKKNKKKTLGEIDLMEIIEEACLKDKFEEYGIQEFNGQVSMKGPAFPTRNEPGMSMGGGLWPVRYVNYCGNMMETLYEDEIYAAYRQGNLFNDLCMKSGSGHCASILKSVPDVVNFKHSLAKEEEICSAGSDSKGKCHKKGAPKTEL